MDDRLGRRDFLRGSLASLALIALARALPGREVFAAALRPLAGRWLAELDQLGREVKSQALAQVEWQKKVEELLGKVELDAFLKAIDFDAIVRKAADYRGLGAKSLTVDLSKADGAPARPVFGRQIFAMKKGRSIVPHGHDNMATAFLVLRGKLRGRHYERHEDQAAHMIISPTIDGEFGPGGTSSISDRKDNVHWFQALSDDAFVFNIHVTGVSPEKKAPSARVYVDPNGEKLEGGRIRARLIDHEEADKLYG
jgi:hypothetical protein